ncbi:hypothetical protein HDU98_003119 [Podochytrium sp. JEL0797]|nr:hypothetical protein HDU98_003119 [Podochytrium sp. JEL0797]
MGFFDKLKASAESAATKAGAAMESAGKKVAAKIDEHKENPEGQTFNQNYAGECTRAATIIHQFVIPSAEHGGLDNTIPTDIISHAKGLAILQVVRAGITVSARYGSGVVIARLPNGTWSAPSVVKTAGVGFGFQIGADITDFVMVLNTDEAVKAFSQGGDIKLGGSLSVAAGPIGRSAEASASMNNTSPVFSYSKSKGLFAGASLEGSAVMEGKEVNEKHFGRVISAQELLSGSVQHPEVAKALYTALESREKLEAEAAAAKASAVSAAAPAAPVAPPA